MRPVTGHIGEVADPHLGWGGGAQQADEQAAVLAVVDVHVVFQPASRERQRHIERLRDMRDLVLGAGLAEQRLIRAERVEPEPVCR